MPMTVDMSGLMRAIREKERTSRYTMAECVNMAAKTIALGSSNGKGLVQLTPKATAAQIKKDMHEMVPGRSRRGYGKPIPRVIALAARWLAKQGRGPRNGSFAEMEAWRQRISEACK